MTESNVCLFLSGAEMDPTAVLAAHPGARFVARARVRVDQHEIAAPFAGKLAGEGEGWGILVAHPGEAVSVGAQGLRPIPQLAVTDEGKEVEAVVDRPLASGEPEAVLAAAKYWELPPAYVGLLRDAIGGVEDEPPR